MPAETPSWTIRHFSRANPAGPGQGSVPALLRRIADSIEAYAGIEVQDLVLHNEITADGDWWSATVYFHDPSDSNEPDTGPDV
ncbi:hypothetical protein U2F26_28465 [Micromonospora sp. 4G57]|uniref:Tautomerase family protein n=1 Tax=Micromonospora sicca TaxID=2202420 RepID=A0ABU5JC63_9ACTN|nr:MULTISPECIES: hypothetical protein [unclassified Micromonospora]MDZ5446612.1 hypothetical protein [Micromonospora sp. 4G57]MDZ5490133.1 hypothetical protein [Micromonospora sp. 4G53]